MSKKKFMSPMAFQILSGGIDDGFIGTGGHTDIEAKPNPFEDEIILPEGEGTTSVFSDGTDVVIPDESADEAYY